MGFQGNLQSYSLGDLFQNISGNNRTGMLKIYGPSGEKYIYFTAGQIRLLAHGKSNKGMLRKVLADSKLIVREHLEAAEKEAAENNTALSNVVLEKGYIEEDNLKALVNFAIEEDIYDLFTWNEANFEFIDGPPDNEIFDGELFAEENVFNTDHLVMEAARRSDEWGRIREVITSDENVFITVNEARNRLETFEQGSAPLQIIMHVDGYRSVGEIINSAGLGKFDVYEGLFHLYQQGIVRHKTFEELFQTGVELKKKGQTGKAIVFLKRALDMQDNVECRRNLAELYEMNAEPKKASEEYMIIGRGYTKNGDEESGLEAFRKVIELDPDAAEPHSEIAEILSAREMMDEAVEEYIHYAFKLLEMKNIQKSREICYRILNIKPQSYEAHRLLAKGYLWEGNSESAIAEYKSLAQALLANMKPKQAIKTYDDILEADCNFPTVKEGVKHFLLKSGEVKSYGLMRFLLTLIILIVLGGVGLTAYFIYNKTLHRKEGEDDLGDLVAVYKDRCAEMKHKDILNQAKKLLQKYYMYDNIKEKAEKIQIYAQDDLQDKVKDKIETSESLIEDNRFQEARSILDDLIGSYDQQGFSFLHEMIGKCKTIRKEINIKIVGEKIEKSYKKSVRDFERGLWAKALASDLEGISNENISGLDPAVFQTLRRYIDEDALLKGKRDLKVLRSDMEKVRSAIGRSDIQKDTILKILNSLDFFKEIIEHYFNGDRLFARYEKLKDESIPEYGPDMLKIILERAKVLGSEKAERVLKEYDNQQAQKLLAEASKLELEGKFESSLAKLRMVLNKYKHTETADDVQYFFVMQTDPEDVFISINGRERGKTDRNKVYRYAPGVTIRASLHYPTFETRQMTINSRKAVYSVEMKRGYEKKFTCKGSIECGLLLSRGNLYLGDSQGYMYSITLDTFTNNWDGIERPFRIGIAGTPFLYRDIYYFGTERGDVAAFSRNGSNKKWPYPGKPGRRSAVVGFEACENPIKMNEFLLFYATEKGDIFALDADTGVLKWNVSRVPGIESGLLVKGTELYTGGNNGIIYGIDIFNPRNVKSVFQINVRKSICTGFTFIKNSALFFGAKDNRIYSIDISGGLSRTAIKNSEFQTNDWVKASVYIHGGKVYCGSYDHHLYCLSLTDDFKMRKEWAFEAEDRIESQPVVSDGTVYFGDASGTLYAVNTEGLSEHTDKVRPAWKYSTGGRIQTGLKTWKQYLLVPTREGIIYGFKIK